MQNKALWGLVIALCATVLLGCTTAVQVGDRVMGIDNGSFFYTDGVLRTNYHTTYDRVWIACMQAMKDLNAVSVLEDKKLANGVIEAILYDEKIRVTVGYKEKYVTTVGVRVGVSGSNISSQFIHEKIKENLLKKPSTT